MIKGIHGVDRKKYKLEPLNRQGYPFRHENHRHDGFERLSHNDPDEIDKRVNGWVQRFMK